MQDSPVLNTMEITIRVVGGQKQHPLPPSSACLYAFTNPYNPQPIQWSVSFSRIQRSQNARSEDDTLKLTQQKNVRMRICLRGYEAGGGFQKWL